MRPAARCSFRPYWSARRPRGSLCTPSMSLCFCVDAGVRVWRVDESKAPDQRIMNVARTSASPALRVAGGGDIVNASVDAKGVPSLGLACKGEALSRRGACVVCAYDSQADAWFEIADALSSSLPPSPEATGLLNEAAREAASRDATTAADLLEWRRVVARRGRALRVLGGEGAVRRAPGVGVRPGPLGVQLRGVPRGARRPAAHPRSEYAPGPGRRRAVAVSCLGGRGEAARCWRNCGRPIGWRTKPNFL